MGTGVLSRTSANDCQGSHAEAHAPSIAARKRESVRLCGRGGVQGAPVKRLQLAQASSPGRFGRGTAALSPSHTSPPPGPGAQVFGVFGVFGVFCVLGAPPSGLRILAPQPPRTSESVPEGPELFGVRRL